MLGDSLTANADWNDLLNRNDVINLGKGSDTTRNYLTRITFNGGTCFVEGGVNDLCYGISEDRIIGNLSLIIDTLLIRKTTPVLTSVILVTTYYKQKPTNGQIMSLNLKIKVLAEQRRIRLIDLNDSLSKGGHLNYALPDGVHLTDKGYRIWKAKIQSVLFEKSF